MDEDGSTVDAPLMRQEPTEAHDGTRTTENSDLREQDLTTPSLFIWALTFSAGISGLLFGYEYFHPSAQQPPIEASKC